MAFSLNRALVTFSLAGALDKYRTKPVEFLLVGADTPAKLAQLESDITAWMTAFNNLNARDATGSTGGVSNAFIVSYTMSLVYIESANIPSFTQDSGLYLEAQLQSIKEDDSLKASTYIPAPASRIFVGDSYNNGKVDPTDTAYTTFGTLYTAGGGNCAISDGEQWQNPLNVTASGVRTTKSSSSS